MEMEIYKKLIECKNKQGRKPLILGHKRSALCLPCAVRLLQVEARPYVGAFLSISKHRRAASHEPAGMRRSSKKRALFMAKRRNRRA